MIIFITLSFLILPKFSITSEFPSSNIHPAYSEYLPFHPEQQEQYKVFKRHYEDDNIDWNNKVARNQIDLKSEQSINKPLYPAAHTTVHVAQQLWNPEKQPQCDYNKSPEKQAEQNHQHNNRHHHHHQEVINDHQYEDDSDDDEENLLKDVSPEIVKLNNSDLKFSSYPHNHHYPHDEKGEILIHRPAPIIVKRPPTKVIVNHPPLIIKPAPVIFHRPPAVIVRQVISKSKPKPVKAKPVHVKIVKPPFENMYVKSKANYLNGCHKNSHHNGLSY